MAKTTIWGYMYMSSASIVEKDHLTHQLSDNSILHVYGVSSVEEACEIAKQFLEEDKGCFLELCGAFDETATEAVRKAVSYQIPIGTVTMSKFDEQLFEEKMKKK